MRQEVTYRKAIRVAGRTGPSRRRHGVWIVAASLVLAAAVWLASEAGTALVVRQPVGSPDAILTLASHEWERLPQTARFAREHPHAIVVLTDPPVITEANCHDCRGRNGALQRMGVDETRIHHVPIVAPGTHGEAAAARAFATAHGIRRLLIVTSPYHTRRSLSTFAEVFRGSGIELGVEAADVSPPIRPGHWWWAPYDRAYVAYEWAAVGFYWWKHGVPMQISGLETKSADK